MGLGKTLQVSTRGSRDDRMFAYLPQPASRFRPNPTLASTHHHPTAVHHAAADGVAAGPVRRAHRPPRHRRVPHIARGQLGACCGRVRVLGGNGVPLRLHSNILHHPPCAHTPPQAAEIKKWVGDRLTPVALAEASRDKATADIRGFLSPSNTADVLIISYETFRIHAAAFHGRPDACDILICDEAHRLKNDATQVRAAAAAAVGLMWYAHPAHVHLRRTPLLAFALTPPPADDPRAGGAGVQAPRAVVGHAHAGEAAERSRATGGVGARAASVVSTAPYPGTPLLLQNDLEEFFAMVDFTNPGILGDAANFRCVRRSGAPVSPRR